MSSQDLQSDQPLHSHWSYGAGASSFNEISSEQLRAKILAEDKIKRRRLLFLSCLILSLIVAIMILLALKPNLIQDPSLVDNIDLLSSNEDINFYKRMEFYQWLDLAAAEQGQ